jgi:SAM-dependent methyltransferase
MTAVSCPVCQTTGHQSFWYWEKEEQLMRVWAPDTQVHFSICRACGLIFQNPLVDPTFFQNMGMPIFGMEEQTVSSPEEPMEWLRQFTGHGKEPVTALEIYTTQPRFQPALAQAGWTVKTIKPQALYGEPPVSESAQPEAGEGSDFTPEFIPDTAKPDAAEGFEFDFDFSMDTGDTPLSVDDQFDIVFCFDGLTQFSQPGKALSTIHSHLKEDGVFYMETDNPLVQPRHKRLCLTGYDACVYPFQTLVFALYQAGFKNHSSELCEKNRILSTKIEPNPDADPVKLIPSDYWWKTLSRFQRNYAWSWVVEFLSAYQTKAQTDPGTLDKVRESLLQRPFDKQYLRDVCGSCLLFIEEVGHLKTTLSQDWPSTMTRIFNVLKDDYALYDLLQLGPLQGVGTFPSLERFHFNEKMIYMATPDYFEKYFSEEESRQLCDSIDNAGRVVIGQLSSLL